MQKKLIVAALAGLAAAPAFAQSNVTVYGRVDMGYRVTDTDTTVRATGVTSNVKDTVAADASGLTTSRLGFMGTEDLGNGLKASFQVEYGLVDADYNSASIGSNDVGGTVTTTTPITNRQFNVGLSGNFGGLKFGRQQTAIEFVWDNSNVGGSNNLIGTLYTVSSSFKGHASRTDRTLSYTTPSMSGATATIQYANGNKDTAGDDVGNNAMSANVVYSAGALTVAAGYNKLVTEGALAVKNEVKAYNVGGNYNFGAARVYAVYANVTDKDKVAGTTTSDRNGWELGVKVPVGAVNLIASYYDGKDDTSNKTVKTDLKGYQLGGLYSFSKRTTGYAIYGSQEATSGNATNSKVDATQYAFGVRHDF